MLNPIARIIAQQALRMGGGFTHWYTSAPCPGRRSDNSACYDPDYGSFWIECPICHGKGITWRHKGVIKTVYTDNSNAITQTPEGSYLLGEKTLSVSPDLGLHILKTRFSAPSDVPATRVPLMDKFIILDAQRRPKEVLFLDKSREPILPSINNGEIYAIVYVKNNY